LSREPLREEPIELLGEDIQGVPESDEAKGGARLLAAPTLWGRASERVAFLRASP
jgi:hypothetical protein